MKKILSTILLFLFLFNFVNAKEEKFIVSDLCQYKSEFKECIEANKSWSTRSIDDFICLESPNYFEIMSQIILDKEFKKLDKQTSEFFKNLEENKNYYFWKDAKEPFTNAIDLLENKFWIYWEYWEKYINSCKPLWEDSILSKTIDCFWWAVPTIEWMPYFLQQSTCKNFVMTKLEINKQIWLDVLKLNKSQIKKDEDKTYMQKERDKYDKLLEIIMVNVWYLERIWKKWPSKTKSAEWS